MAINFDSLPTSIDGGFGAIIPKELTLLQSNEQK